MTGLERRALLGDRQAQEECTEKGIMLPCPFCNGKVFCALPSGFFCTECGLKFCFPAGFTPEKCFEKYNTRPAPPIGRCGECAHWYKKHCAHGPCATEPTDADFFCGSFEPKGGEENAV